MHPIFFSVAGNNIEFAEQVWARFTSDFIYLYSKTGRKGAPFWEEIEQNELPNARAIVIFWSVSFASQPGTRREIELAARLFRTGQLRAAVILRLDDFPMVAQSGETNEDVVASWEHLSAFLGVTRASDINVTVEVAIHQCDTLVARYSFPNPPVFARPMLEEEFFRQARIDQRTLRPVVWVSGLNGQGRETLIREVYRRIDVNAVAVSVDISEFSIPKQLVLRLESAAFRASDKRLREINDHIRSDTVESVAEVLIRIRQAGRYTILKQRRVVEDRVNLPEWLFDIAKVIDPTASPVAFIVAQVPVAADILRSCGDHLGAVRVTALLEHEAEEFAWSLVRHFDPKPDRWSDDLIRRVSRETGGNPELILSIIRLGSRLADLTRMTEIMTRETARFSESLSNYVAWAISELPVAPEILQTLRLLQDLSPASPEMLREMLGSAKPIARVLDDLQSVGLIEGTDAGLFRLSPLLARRLDRYLIEPALLEWHRGALRRFVRAPHNTLDVEHGYIRIEAAISAALWFGRDAIPEDVRDFVSAAHWFQAGVRLYGARRYPEAHEAIGAAFELRGTFRVAARLEVCRYFGLVSVRVHNTKDIARAITMLRGLAGGADMIEYILGFQAEMDRRFFDAIEHYSEALRYAQTGRQVDREARILRPLISCILRTPQPNFAKAENLAQRAVEVNRTMFSLLNYAKVLLNRFHRDADSSEAGRTEIWNRYLDSLAALERDPGGAGAYAEVRAEEAQFVGEWSEAIAWMDQAIAADRRFESRLRRWKIMVRSKEPTYCAAVLDEIDSIFGEQAFRPDVMLFKNHLAEAYMMAQKVLGRRETFRVDQYGQGLCGPAKARIVSDVRRLDPSDAGFMSDLV